MAKYIIYIRGLNLKCTSKRENKNTKNPQRTSTSTLKMPNPLTTAPQRTNTTKKNYGTKIKTGN